MTATETIPPVDLDPTVAAWLEAARTAKAEIARLTQIYDRAVDHVKQAMGDAAEARVGGRPAVTWAWSKPSPYIDKKALEADHPDIAARYTRMKQPARPFKLIASKDGE